MGDFNKAIKVILRNEGSYVFDADDPGGETNYGISKRAYPKLDIKALTIAQATEIYRQDYWEKVKGDDIENSQLALHVFDMAVNAGVQTATELLQKASGTIVDGRLGPITLKAVNGYPRKVELVWKYKYQRACYYARLAANNTKLARYLNGWIKRVENSNIYPL